MKERYKLENINNRITVFGFVFVLVLMLALCILTPDKSNSENENRGLQALPKWTTDSILDGSYMKTFENYASDNIIGRDGWVAVKNNLDIASGKKDNGSVYYGKAGYLFAIETADYKQLEKNILYTKIFLEQARQENPTIKLSVLLAPTSTEVMENKLPRNAQVLNQKAILNRVIDGLNKVKIAPQNKEAFADAKATMNIIPVLKAKNDEYVYYRTDHHWTTLGAYYAYKAWTEQMGIEARKLDEFNIIAVSDDFYGTTYSKAAARGIYPDTMERFELEEQNNCLIEITLQGKTRTIHGLYDESYLNKKDKYAYYLSGNNALTTINTGVKNSRKILVVKDSYANCFIPFLTENFETIIAVDMRYFKENPVKIIKEENITDLLILYNIVQFANDRNFVYLSKL